MTQIDSVSQLGFGILCSIILRIAISNSAERNYIKKSLKKLKAYRPKWRDREHPFTGWLGKSYNHLNDCEIYCNGMLVDDFSDGCNIEGGFLDAHYEESTTADRPAKQISLSDFPPLHVLRMTKAEKKKRVERSSRVVGGLAANDPVSKRGKGEAIYVPREESADEQAPFPGSADRNRSSTESLPGEKKIKYEMSTNKSTENFGGESPAFQTRVPAESVNPAHLRSLYGHGYAEVTSVPRRFLLDLTDRCQTPDEVSVGMHGTSCDVRRDQRTSRAIGPIYLLAEEHQLEYDKEFIHANSEQNRYRFDILFVNNIKLRHLPTITEHDKNCN